ncbi:hypothetical protein CY35_07G012700 [Sphagnum magellanicum]|uniref:Uncharacterized protein n=1 Tax=Sphagnum magellanicum TaxID=128215 RepID=A0ACB8HK93_9BRYO|nr:hypothetical protein CY35_07G012700 [Sphagnum magellanicum]
MARLVDYFVVCGLGPDLHAIDGSRGFQGTGMRYQPALLDQFPPLATPECHPPPPQLPLCVLPGGVEIYSTGPNSQDPSSFPRSYPIVLTDGDGSKIYVSCVAFRDPLDDDVAEAYSIPRNSYVDKCICLVSHSACFQVFREALEELHRRCFSASGCSKPIWDIVAHMVTSVPLPSAGKSQILFTVENHLLTVQAPLKGGLPHADMSFEPLVRCLDVDNVLRFFTAILLERRVLLRANKYSVLTMVAEAVCHLIYPIKWQHVYIPVLFYAGVDYIDAPTPYLMGLHSAVDTTDLTMDGVVVVNLDNNQVDFTPEDIPALPEPEGSQLRAALLQLVHPNLVQLDCAQSSDSYLCRFSKPWCQDHDRELRLIFLQFLASILSGYRDFVDTSHEATNVFNTQAFLKKRSRIANVSSDDMVGQLLGTLNFLDFLERGHGAVEAGPNLLDKLQIAMARHEGPISVLSVPAGEREILTVSDASSQGPVSRHRHCYDRFPANIRTPAQDEKRRATLAAAATISPSFSRSAREGEHSKERAAERDLMVLDIKVKLQGLWKRLINLSGAEDPLSSSEYGTIFALIESDVEGIGGSGLVECLREHIQSGWRCDLTDQQFMAVKELMKTTINRATMRGDMPTVCGALEITAEIYRKDLGNVTDYIQRHLGTLPVWDELRFWEFYFEKLENASDKTGSYADIVTEQLVVLAKHMAGLGLRDSKAWLILESIAQKNNLGFKQLIKLRGLLSLMKQVGEGYWGLLPEQAVAVHAQQQQQQLDQSRSDVNHQPSSEAAGIGRSWVQSMFSRDRAVQTHSATAGRPRGSQSVLDRSETSRNLPAPNLEPASGAGLKRGSSGVRLLRGHKASVTALHVGTRAEMGDLASDSEDSGFFISGSADCTVKIWDPSMRGSELCVATLIGHTRAIRAISSDRRRVVSGSDDQRVLVWDKSTRQLLEELKGHEGKVSCVRMLSGDRVLTASHDGSLKMWDIRTDSCVATVGKSTSSVLCMDYDDSSGVLAAAGVDGVGNVWDIRGGKQMQRLMGHTKWIRSLRMVGDIIVTGSDDWTARVWSASRGSCDAVLASHAGAVTNVEFCAADSGIITGGLSCVSSLEGVHLGTVLSIKAGERLLAVGAADNSMSLFHRSEQLQAGRVPPWKLLRTPPRAAAVVRCVAPDVERGRICSGARNGLLRLWEPVLDY